MPHMEGIFINGEKAKFRPEDILDTDASQYTEEIGESVTAYLTEHITNPSNPPIDTSLSIAGAAADAKKTGDELTQLKSELSALTSDGVVPSAGQILSDKGVTDSVPYHYRKTGGDGADRLYDQIVGGTVCWNQLAYDFIARAETLGITITVDNTKGSITASGTATATNRLYFMTALRCLQDHKYLFRGSKGTGWLGILSTSAKDTGNGAIFNVTAAMTGDNQFIYGFSEGDVINETLYPQVFDLTAMFGSTIADHIYSLEQATAGAGVALFRSLFPKDYYAYDAGSMQSVSGLSEHKTVGFNQFDKSTASANKAIDGTGAVVNGLHYVSDLIKCFGNTEYYFQDVIKAIDGRSICFYDENQAFISTTGPNGSASATNGTAVTPINARYIRIMTDYIDSAVVNISDHAKDGTYEPYDGHSYALDDSLTLRGIPTLVDGKIKWDGDVYSADGKVNRRYGIVDLGAIGWSKINTSEGHWRFNAILPSVKNAASVTTVANVLCSKYQAITANSTWTGTTGIAVNNSGNTIIVCDESYSDAAAFNTAMSGVYLVYELATPTTEQADPYISPQICHADGTEEFVSTGIVPVGHNTKYPDNMRAKLDGLPWNFASLIAPTESAFVATRNYTTGSLFIVDNVLYKATANIANGGTITPNTNCTATTLAEIISALA